MKKYTLLEIVTSVLDSMGGDQISTIEGSAVPEEALQIISVAKDLYFFMATDQEWKHLKVTKQLTALADITHPSHMQFPSGLESVEVVKYDVREAVADQLQFQEIDFIEDPSQFLFKLHSRDSTETTIDTITDFGGATLLIKNDSAPSFWTTFDDDYVVFDAYDSNLETSLVAAKSVVVGVTEPTWTETDAFVPNMPGKMFPTYLETLKAICHEDIQKEASAWHTKLSEKGNTRLSQKNTKTKNPNGVNRRPHYGRK